MCDAKRVEEWRRKYGPLTGTAYQKMEPKRFLSEEYVAAALKMREGKNYTFKKHHDMNFGRKKAPRRHQTSRRAAGPAKLG